MFIHPKQNLKLSRFPNSRWWDHTNSKVWRKKSSKKHEEKKPNSSTYLSFSIYTEIDFSWRNSSIIHRKLGFWEISELTTPASVAGRATFIRSSTIQAGKLNCCIGSTATCCSLHMLLFPHRAQRWRRAWVRVFDLVQALRSRGRSEHGEDSHIRAAHRQLAPSDDALALAS